MNTRTLILVFLAYALLSSCGRNSDDSTICSLINQSETSKKSTSDFNLSGDTNEVAVSDCAGTQSASATSASLITKLSLEGETEISTAEESADTSGDTTTSTNSFPAKPTEYSVVGSSLIVNGSFENNNLKTKSWKVLKSIEGWTTSSGPGIEVQNAVAGTAYEGNSKVELDSHGATSTNSAMVQEFKTSSSTKYRLSFAYSPRQKVSLNSNRIEVHWNGTTVATLAENGKTNTDTSWTVHTLDLTGGDGTTKLEFAAKGKDDTFGGYIDSVSVYALVAKVDVPVEPAKVAPIIIDNKEATVVGDWESSTAVTGYNGVDYIHNKYTRAEDKAVSFDFKVTNAGYWQVFARWTEHSNRATNAAYNIMHADGRARTVVNQRTNGGAWNDLGVYRFGSDTGRVMLTGSIENDGYIIADAIKVVYIGLTPPSYALSSPITLDNNDARYVSVVGTWQHSTAIKQFEGSDYLHDDNRLQTTSDGVNISESKQVIFAPDFAKAGKYKVYVRWTSHPNRATNALVIANYSGGQERFTVNQQKGGGEYNEIGTYTFAAGRSKTAGSITIQRPDDANGYVIADSVKFVLVE